MLRKIRAVFQSKSGVTALEYGVIAAIIVVAVASTIGAVGNNLGNTFNKVADALK